ncbi:hypothetical protein [Absidia glauca]|uniref:BZIP domain-containing protein n=1 Tax=Absidia glauca TaxID=4829 RepID=A0A163MFI1_ABSGL|nr:hypothetical protein [Absidia glauca]
MLDLLLVPSVHPNMTDDNPPITKQGTTRSATDHSDDTNHDNDIKTRRTTPVSPGDGPVDPLDGDCIKVKMEPDASSVKCEPDTTNIPIAASVPPLIPALPPLLIDQHLNHLLQAYAQASGQDLAHLTTSIAPLPNYILPNLTTVLPAYTTEDPALHEPSQPLSHPPRNMSNDERRQRRLLRNRVAAKECRKKKKHYIQTMEEKVARLEKENAALRRQVMDRNLALEGYQKDTATTSSAEQPKEIPPVAIV